MFIVQNHDGLMVMMRVHDVGRYGWDVVTYYSLPYRDRVNPAMAIRWGHSRAAVTVSLCCPGTRCALSSPPSPPATSPTWGRPAASRSTTGCAC